MTAISTAREYQAGDARIAAAHPDIRSTNAASVEYAHSIGLLFATYARFEVSFEP